MSIEAKYFNTEGSSNEKPSLKQLEERLNILKVDIESNKNRIVVLNNYIAAIEKEPEKAILGSKEEAESSVKSWELVIKNQQAEIDKLEAEVVELKK